MPDELDAAADAAVSDCLSCSATRFFRELAFLLLGAGSPWSAPTAERAASPGGIVRSANFWGVLIALFFFFFFFSLALACQAEEE